MNSSSVVSDLIAYRVTDQGEALFLDGVDLSLVAQSQSPAYVYGLAGLDGKIRDLRAACASGSPITWIYAVKANHHLPLLRRLFDGGLGADIVSMGEAHRCLAAGLSAESIVYSGMGKTVSELAEAVAMGVGRINLESFAELAMLNAAAEGVGRTMRASVRLNPKVDARTLDQISTGRVGDKFGVDLDDVPALFREAKRLKGVILDGLAVHIGSNIGDLEALRSAFITMRGLVQDLRGQGYGVGTVDVGGGLPVSYEGEAVAFTLEEYVQVVRETLEDLGCPIIAAPGRWLVAQQGVLLTTVVLVKRTYGRTFVVVDAAMNDLIRPALYGVSHRVWPLRRSSEVAQQPVSLVGPVCESTDAFFHHQPMPPLNAGDHLAVLDVGAYGVVMASGFNGRSLPAQVVVDADRWAVSQFPITARQLMSFEREPGHTER